MNSTLLLAIEDNRALSGDQMQPPWQEELWITFLLTTSFAALNHAIRGRRRNPGRIAVWLHVGCRGKVVCNPSTMLPCTAEQHHKTTRQRAECTVGKMLHY